MEGKVKEEEEEEAKRGKVEDFIDTQNENQKFECFGFGRRWVWNCKHKKMRGRVLEGEKDRVEKTKKKMGICLGTVRTQDSQQKCKIRKSVTRWSSSSFGNI